MGLSTAGEVPKYSKQNGAELKRCMGYYYDPFLRELYKDALDNVSAFNARLCYERKMRVPFLDAQTGIAMINSNLWLSKMMRRPGTTPHYIYSYPAKRWRKKKRKARIPQRPKEDDMMTAYKEQDIAVIEEVENIEEAEEVYVLSSQETRKEIPIKELQTAVPEPSDNEEIEQETGAVSTDDEEFEIINVKRKRGRPGRKKKTPVATTGPALVPVQVKNISKEELAKMDPEDRKKPYVCEICGKRYKNGPGLKYHYLHYNHEQESSMREEETVSHPSTPNPVEPTPLPSRGPGRPRKEVSFPPQLIHQVAPPPQTLSAPRIVSPNNYCDFCLGDVTENKKSGYSEELLSCADCGRSGHPTCLQFTSMLTESVKKYKWQCIECKSCTKCGTSDNDDQLLFCDDCDRGYHMYCLRPPMEHPPEGHWTCKLCKDAIHLPPYPIAAAN